jgi:hypothetical protein
MRGDEIPCPYCWAQANEPCAEECPQYPISFQAGVVVADARTLGRVADDLPVLRAGRTRPVGVAESWEAYDV